MEKEKERRDSSVELPVEGQWPVAGHLKASDGREWQGLARVDSFDPAFLPLFLFFFFYSFFIFIFDIRT